MEFRGANGQPSKLVFGEETLYFSTSQQSNIFAYRYTSSALNLYSTSESQSPLVEVSINQQETYLLGYKKTSQTVYAFSIVPTQMYMTFSYYVNIYTINKIQFGDSAKEIYFFYQERIEYTSNFFSQDPQLIVKLSEVAGPSTTHLSGGHYILNKKVLIVLTNEMSSFYYKLCDSSVTGDCENSVANSFVGCGDKTKYSDDSGTCQSCDAKCDGCFGGTDYDCYACLSPYIVSDGQCILPITPTCDSTCATCSGSASNECLSCNSSRQLSADNYCCDVNNGYEIEDGTGNCIESTEESSCGLSECNFCQSDIAGGQCLDDIITRVKENSSMQQKCFLSGNYDDNFEFCQSNSMVSFHSQIATQTFQKLVIYTSFQSNSDQYISTFLEFLQELQSSDIQEYIELIFEPEISTDSINEIIFSVEPEQRIMSTELTFKEDLSDRQLTIRPKFWNFVQDLPTVTLVRNRLLENSEENNLLGGISSLKLKNLIDLAGGLNKLDSLFNYRTTQYTQQILLTNLKQSLVVDFSKILTIGYILGILLKLFFICLILIAILGSFLGVNIKSRLLHFWVYITLILTVYFSGNGYSMAPVFRKFIEMVVLGWYSDFFELKLTVQKFSKFKTISYERLEHTSVGYIFGNLFRLVILLNLMISKLVALKCDNAFKMELYNFPNLKNKSLFIRFYYQVNRHLNTLGLLICLHIFTSNLVDYKMSLDFIESGSLIVKLNRTWIYLSILISQFYILLFAIDFFTLIPDFRKLFSLSLFMRIDLGLSIKAHRLRFKRREDDYYASYKLNSIEENQSLLQNSGNSVVQKDHELDSIIQEGKRDSISVLQKISVKQKYKKKKLKNKCKSKKDKVPKSIQIIPSHPSSSTLKEHNTYSVNSLAGFRGDGEWELPSMVAKNDNKQMSPQNIISSGLKVATPLSLQYQTRFNFIENKDDINSSLELEEKQSIASKRTPQFRKKLGIERMALDHHRNNITAGKNPFTIDNDDFYSSMKQSNGFETIYFEEEIKNQKEPKQKNSFLQKFHNYTNSCKVIQPKSFFRKKKSSIKLLPETPKKHLSRKKITLGLSSNEKITTPPPNLKYKRAKRKKVKRKSSKKRKKKYQEASRKKSKNQSDLFAFPLEIKKIQVSKKKTILKLDTKKSKKTPPVKFHKEKSKFALEQNPVEHNNKQESRYVNEKVDEYLFMVLDSINLFNFNQRELQKEYTKFQSVLKGSLKKKEALTSSQRINQQVRVDFIIPLIHYLIVQVIPALILISLFQISSSTNAIIINISVCFFIGKIGTHKFFRMNVMKTPFQYIILCTSMAFTLLINFFQVFFFLKIVPIGFWAYQVQIFCMIFLSCILLGNMGWILYEVVDTFYSWRRYKSDKGWEHLKKDYELFRTEKKNSRAPKTKKGIINKKETRK